MKKLDIFDLLKAPVVTEKSNNLSQENKLVFFVQKSATKEDVKRSVEALFDVSVESVNIMNIKGKKKRYRGRIGKCADQKKAIVTVSSESFVDVTMGI